MKNYLKFGSMAAMIGLFALAVSCGDDETVADLLVTSDRVSGKIYTINTKTGELKERFTPMFNGDPLNDVRSIVYHPKKKLFYVSNNSYTIEETPRKGLLFTVDPKTKTATLINDNDGKVNPEDEVQSYDVWDAIVNWAVASDDSLLAVGDFNDNGNGFVKFGTDGGRSLKTVEAPVCCGLGMIYDASTNVAILGNGWDWDYGTVIIEEFNTTTGESLESTIITTFVDFPAEFMETYEDDRFSVKGLARKGTDGTIFGLLYNNYTNKTYFVSFDLEDETVTYISTLGVDQEHQFNSLSFIPESKL